MELMGILIAVIVAVVPTIVELRRDGLHRLDERDEWRGLRSHHVDYQPATIPLEDTP